MTEVEVLNGPRVRMRAPTLDDAQPLFEHIASDPDVTRYMAWRTHSDLAETRRVVTDIFNVGGETTWLIEPREGGDPMGVIGWRRPQPHLIDFGYYLAKRWWRRGYMSEAVQLLLDKAHRDPTVYRVSAYCHVDNTASAPPARTQRADTGRPPGAVCRAAEHQRRTAGLSDVRRSGQVTEPRTAHARARSERPVTSSRRRRLDCSACTADSSNDAT